MISHSSVLFVAPPRYGTPTSPSPPNPNPFQSMTARGLLAALTRKRRCVTLQLHALIRKRFKVNALHAHGRLPQVRERYSAVKAWQQDVGGSWFLGRWEASSPGRPRPWSQRAIRRLSRRGPVPPPGHGAGLQRNMLAASAAAGWRSAAGAPAPIPRIEAFVLPGSCLRTRQGSGVRCGLGSDACHTVAHGARAASD